MLSKKMVCLVLFCLSKYAHGQYQVEVDSLLDQISTDHASKNNVDIYNQISRIYEDFDTSSTFLYTEKAIKESEEISYSQGIVEAYWHRGWALQMVGALRDAQGYYERSIDLAQRSELPLLEAKVYNSYGILFYSLGEFDSAIWALKGSIALKDSLGMTEALAASYNNLANLYRLISENDEAIFHFNKSIELAELLGDEAGVAAAYGNLGLFYQEIGSFNQALDHYLKALRMAERLELVDISAKNLMNIGYLYLEQFEHNKALDYFFQTLEVIDSSKVSTMLSNTYHNIGVAYYDMDSIDRALEYYEKSLKQREEIGNDYQIVNSHQNIAQVYTRKGDYLAAEKHAKLALALSEGHDNNFRQSHTLQVLARIRLQQGRLFEAISSVEEALEIAVEREERAEIRDCYKLLMEIQRESGDLNSALNAYDHYHQYYDTLLGEQKSRQLKQLEVQYETEKKEQEIASLNQQATIQSLELQQSRLNLTILVVAVALLLLVILVLYLINRQKHLRLLHRSHDIEQKLLRVQMNPHFIFNAMTSIQDYMLQGDAKKAGFYLTKFSKLIRQVLDNSRSEYITLRQEVTMLDNYLSIQNIRLDRPFIYEIVLDEQVSLDEVAIPPMFAQPFVENAIEHGISGVENGEIRVHFSILEEQLVLTVSDNGRGLETTANINTKTDHVSHATEITQERVELFRQMTQKNITFNVRNLFPGTEVMFHLPYQIL